MKKIDAAISCDVCQDLIPLVLDQVASEDSVNLVMNHIANCEPCRMCYGDPAQIETNQNKPDDQRILYKIKKTLGFSLLLLVLIGGLFGVALTNSQNIFYNSIIMPIVGSLCYVVYRRRWYLPCVGLAVISYLWIFITCWLEGGFTPLLFAMPLIYVLIYCILLAIGVCIAALLTYAFGKEKMV